MCIGMCVGWDCVSAEMCFESSGAFVCLNGLTGVGVCVVCVGVFLKPCRAKDLLGPAQAAALVAVCPRFGASDLTFGFLFQCLPLPGNCSGILDKASRGLSGPQLLKQFPFSEPRFF